jgi:hypothetical protein
MSQRNQFPEMISGIFVVLALHFAAFWLLFLLIYLIAILNNSFPTPIGTYLTTDYRFFILLSVPGLTQLLYVIPLVFWLKRRQRWGLMKGVISGAVITALLNGGCWLLLVPHPG